MKTRQDFVSNSSSCSFVVAINSTYPVKDFAKDLGKACTNSKDEYHDKELTNRNRRILDFCLNTYQLLFLGSIDVGTYEDVVKKADFYDPQDPDDREPRILEGLKEIWDNCLDQYKRAKAAPKGSYLSKCSERDWINEAEDEIHHFYDQQAARIIVDNDTMHYDFSRFHYSDEKSKDRYDEKPDQVKQRVKQIMKWAKQSCDPKHEGRQSDCYAITMDTILNTRNLIKSGIKVNLDKWEDRDDLERRLKAGEQLFGIRIAHSGDGYGSYYIYSEENASGIDHLAAEILTSESM